MAISVVCRFADDSVQIINADYGDFGEAVLAALQLADHHGSDKGDGHGPPKRFEVCVGGRVELAVAVVAGGLLGLH